MYYLWMESTDRGNGTEHKTLTELLACVRQSYPNAVYAKQRGYITNGHTNEALDPDHPLVVGTYSKSGADDATI